MIAVIDYGMGNLRSVEKALQRAGAKTKITCNPADFKRCDKLVFPGVGSFGDSIKEMKKLKLVEPIKESIASGKPFLGLCLGMQLLFEKSEEAPGVKGLCVLEGEVVRFKAKNNLKIPHIGWNSIDYRPKTGDKRQKILKGAPAGSYMYFVHSYYVKPRNKKVIVTTTDYGVQFASGVASGNIYGFQFHPEKSQSLGLEILRNFVKL